MGENKYNDKSETLDSQNKETFPETASDFEFLQEKIKERPINKKKLFRRMVITASLAVLFGVLACLSFLLLEPILNNWLYPEEQPEIVTFPQEKDEMRPEDMLTEGTTTSQETEAQTISSEGKKDEEQRLLWFPLIFAYSTETSSLLSPSPEPPSIVFSFSRFSFVDPSSPECCS